jgi:hypothetical protein
MKKTGLMLLLLLAGAAVAQQADPVMAAAGAATDQGSGQAARAMTVSTHPIEHLQAPTYADQYCAGFISKDLLPNASYVAGGLNSPNTTKYVIGDVVYLAGSGYQEGQQYEILRELRDPNRFESYKGQHSLVKAVGQPYAELGRVRIVDTRNKMAIAQVEYSCEPMLPGDIVAPFQEKPQISLRPAGRFDRFAPSNGKTSGRIILARDFDSLLGTGSKVFLNVGANQGVKVGDYFRSVRPYSYDQKDPVDSISFKATMAEDTQLKAPKMEASGLMMMSRGSGPMIRVAEFPRRAVGEMIVLSVTPTTSTAMIIFAPEDTHVGDDVELEQY